MAFREDPYYVKRILEGDTAAFSALVDKYKDWVFTIVFRILRNREETEETAQDVFLKAYRSLNKYRGKSKFSTWLFSIAYNTAISKSRKRKLKTADLEEKLIENYTEDAINEDLSEYTLEVQQRLIDRALEKLNDEDNLMIRLFYKNDNSIEEIAEIMGLGGSNVKVRLHRIRNKLLTEINHLSKIENQENAF
ncbi:MAG: sigma-70 family RNA polymerase sigma factor [Bacteroidales bacterium]|nr:sigma-70 family RNA polymerase sigma factor [Bacteroidales bacterium]